MYFGEVSTMYTDGHGFFEMDVKADPVSVKKPAVSHFQGLE